MGVNEIGHHKIPDKYIHMINGGFTGGKVTKYSRKRHLKKVYPIGKDCDIPDLPTISFTKEDAQRVTPGHDDPMVITMILANAILHRTLMDHWSSADVLYEPAFDKLGLEEKELKAYPDNLFGLGDTHIQSLDFILLHTSFGKGMESRTLSIDYVVVASAYNALIELRSWGRDGPRYWRRSPRRRATASCRRIHPAVATSAEERGCLRERRAPTVPFRVEGSVVRGAEEEGASVAPPPRYCRRGRSFVHRRRSLAPPKKPPTFVPRHASPPVPLHHRWRRGGRTLARSYCRGQRQRCPRRLRKPLPPTSCCRPAWFRVDSRRHAWPPEPHRSFCPFLSPENLAAVAGELFRRRDWNSSPLPLEVAAGLPPSRFGDCRRVGSAVPPSVRVVESVAKVAGS
ncbi:uncharacterized protein [Arachis hypogaea]|uniref:uncharacterized protein n=1 Tax=Arachis hypogaea TaxID=3818 RepID=UPI000DEC6B86